MSRSRGHCRSFMLVIRGTFSNEVKYDLIPE